jgi:hypothetical protein
LMMSVSFFMRVGWAFFTALASQFWPNLRA